MEDLTSRLTFFDEMGFESMSRQDASLFFRLVSYRYGRGHVLDIRGRSHRLRELEAAAKSTKPR